MCRALDSCGSCKAPSRSAPKAAGSRCQRNDLSAPLRGVKAFTGFTALRFRVCLYRIHGSENPGTLLWCIGVRIRRQCSEKIAAFPSGDFAGA